MIKHISLGEIPRCEEFNIMVPHEIKNFDDDIVISNLIVTGIISNSNNCRITTDLTSSNNFKLLFDNKYVKLLVSNNDTFFDEVYVTINYTRISVTNSFYGMHPMPTKMALNSIYGKSIYELPANVNLGIKKVIFNKPATIVLWEDGSKTVVKVNKGERWDKEKGLAMAIIKKKFGLKEFFKYIEKKKKKKKGRI